MVCSDFMMVYLIYMHVCTVFMYACNKNNLTFQNAALLNYYKILYTNINRAVHRTIIFAAILVISAQISA